MVVINQMPHVDFSDVYLIIFTKSNLSTNFPEYNLPQSLTNEHFILFYIYLILRLYFLFSFFVILSFQLNIFLVFQMNFNDTKWMTSNENSYSGT